MSNLQDSSVSRCGVTSRYLSHETNNIKASVKQSKLRIFFVMASKGGGQTEVYLDIGANDFSEILSAMSKADRASAMTAMAGELTRQVKNQPARDEEVAKQARQALVESAEEEFRAAPIGEDAIERVVWQRVERLAAELDTAEEDSVAA